ncbi:N-acetyltransferase [Methylobacterium sp. BTF04]|uniref:GNAT family N-acetyltransferase n=1 Tax=Methylobacterium sp. BTF04 TaxID=2708300 RepID=UPI0013D17C1D|nr:N-acetyltransferase [Methylobacterium sp. BTF04]NEU12037.1 N-acetyltransferase [Methylobacterium sp. BTF04]
MVLIRDERPGDHVARDRLLDTCFGDSRLMKTSERLREGRLTAWGLALIAERQGRTIGTVRLWHVEAGAGRAALLLGPIAVDPTLQSCGLGGRLMRAALQRAQALGHGGVVLVGDAPYYARFGFAQGIVEGLFMPGPFERKRFLGLELRRGALDGARGVLRASGVFDRTGLPAVADAAAASRRRVA